jgi:predicted glycoside hydrolase/deacetylase ChbG (UPF0249 family)
VGTSGSTTSLVDGYGFFPPDCATFEQSADADEVRAEIVAQFARAEALGVDATHADNHMGSLYGLATGRDFLEIVLEECAARGLPFRLPRSADLYGVDIPEPVRPIAEQLVAARGAYADSLGVVLPDYTWTYEFALRPGETYESVKADLLEMLRATRPGVTEIYLHPFEDDDELRDIAPGSQKRGWELALLRDDDVRTAIVEEGIHRTGWRELRDLQRGTAR